MYKHGVSQAAFEKLDFGGQARSINGTIRHLERAIAANVRKGSTQGRDVHSILKSRIEIAKRMLDRLARKVF